MIRRREARRIDASPPFDRATKEALMNVRRCLAVLTVLIVLTARADDPRSESKRYNEKKELELTLGYTLKPHLDGATQLDSNGHWYKRIEVWGTWAQSQKWCQNNGGHLVTITTEDEYALVMKLARETDFWLGATDEHREGRWKWVTAEPFTLKYWYTDRPKALNENDDFLAALWHEDRGNSKGKWFDVNESRRCVIICEWVE
jgi:hypothetical protein